jgi:hypothetical protein
VIRRCGNPLARLADRGVREPDQRERREALAHVRLDPDLARLDAEQRVGADDRGHGGEPTDARRAGGARKVTFLVHCAHDARAGLA